MTDLSEPDGLDAVLEAVTKAYDVLLDQVRSTQDRCGIAVGVSVAGITALASRFVAIFPFFIEEGHTWAVLAAAFLSFWFLLGGAAYFVYGFVHDNQYLPINLEC